MTECTICGGQIARLHNDGGAVWIHLAERPPVNHQATPAGATEPESCEHGLSAWLCAGPGHYPQDGAL